jgi:CRP-like cAMP-binding protein
MVTRIVEPLPLTVLRTGGVLVTQGARCPGAWTVETGVLYVETVDVDGRRLILDVLGPGDLAGGAEGPVSPLTVRAVRPSRLRPCGDAVAWRRRAAHDARAARAALSMAYDDVPTRVEARLGDLAARFGRPVPGGVAIGLPVPQDDLAAMTGATRESVNRAVRRAVGEGRLMMPRRSRYVVVTQLRLVP